MKILPLLYGVVEAFASFQPALACDACRKPLVGTYHINEWGHRLCASHQDQPGCDACGALLPKAPLPDTPLPLCPACAPQAPGLPAATALLVRVQKDLRTLGLPWWPQTFPLRAVSHRELKQSTHPGLAESPLGQARCSFIPNAPPGTPRKIEEILVVQGLHELRLGAVLAHELGHAWLWQQGFMELPLLLSEGFPELCAFRWLGTSHEPFARILQTRMERNPDLVYGAGFRLVRQAFLREPNMARSREFIRSKSDCMWSK